MNGIAQKAAVAKEKVKNSLGMNNVHLPGSGAGHTNTETKFKSAVGMGPGSNPNTTSHF